MATVLRGLAFREIVLSMHAVVIAVLCISSPLLIAVVYNAVPSYVYTVFEKVIPSGTGSVNMGLGKLLGGMVINRTAIRVRLRGYLDMVNIVLFILIGVLTVFSIAKPIEYRYFFIEALFRGSKLRAYVERYSLLLAMAVLVAVLMGFVCASVLYVDDAFESFAQCYAYSLPSLLLTCFSSISIASLISLYVRRSAEGVLAFLGLMVLVLLLSSKYGDLKAVVMASRIIYAHSGGGVYLASIVLSNSIALHRVVTLEY